MNKEYETHIIEQEGIRLLKKVGKMTIKETESGVDIHYSSIGGMKSGIATPREESNARLEVIKQRYLNESN